MRALCVHHSVFCPRCMGSTGFKGNQKLKKQNQRVFSIIKKALKKQFPNLTGKGIFPVEEKHVFHCL